MTAPARARADIEQYIDLKVPAYGRRAVSRFRVLIWRRGAAGTTVPLVVMSDAPSSKGPSITNAAEEAWEWAQRRYPGCMLVEHYPETGRLLPDRCAIVEVVAGRPRWVPAGASLAALITEASR
jgi:hypothetical protein